MRKLPQIKHPQAASKAQVSQSDGYSSKPNIIGKATPHESAQLHLTGKALYIDDIAVPVGCLHAYVGMATVACGLLASQDLRAVASADGVVDVITAKDIPGQVDIGAVFAGDPLLVEEQINYFGQPLFAVVV